MGTKPTEQLASRGKRYGVHRDLEREKEVLNSFNYVRVDVSGKDIPYIQYIQGDLHTLNLGKRVGRNSLSVRKKGRHEFTRGSRKFEVPWKSSESR